MKYPITVVNNSISEDTLSTFLKKIRLRINGFGHQHNKSVGYRVNTDFEFIYITDGEVTIEINDKTYIGSGGDIIIIPPFAKNSITASQTNPASLYWVHFDVNPFYLSDNFLLLFIGGTQEHKIHIGDSLWLVAMLREIESETKSVLPACQLVCTNIFTNILAKTIRCTLLDTDNKINLPSISSKENKIIIAATEYIKNNLNRRLSVSEIAETIFISEAHLYRIFASMLNISPTVYIGRLKAQKAKFDIDTAELSLYEIAENLGFKNYYYFSTFFKKIYGVSPKKYKETTKESDNGTVTV